MGTPSNLFGISPRWCGRLSQSASTFQDPGMCWVMNLPRLSSSVFSANSAPIQFNTGDGAEALEMVAKATTLSARINKDCPLIRCFHFLMAIKIAQASNGPCPAGSSHGMPIHLAYSSVKGISRASSGMIARLFLSMSAKMAPTPLGEASVINAN